MDFVKDEIQKYADRHTSEESPLLAELNRETHVKILQPRMLSGHFQGRTLAMFSKMINPKYILEIGTYTGYSALCLAEGLCDHGHLFTIEQNEELKSFANKYFIKSEFADQITMIIGDAQAVIPTLDYQWDLVFIDADKVSYSKYYDLVLDRVSSGGYILADNILWSGKVVEKPMPNDKNTQALIAFNNKIHQDNRVENVLLPIRDGLMLLRKK